jgi:hypothetical protein
MEEERARQQAATGGNATDGDKPAVTSPPPPPVDPMAVEANPAEDAELARALALSMGKVRVVNF